MKNTKLHIGLGDYVKGMKTANRAMEIELYGKQISMRGPRFHRSKKVYNRHDKSYLNY